MAQYRMFPHEFWVDHRLLKLSTQRRVREILILNHVETGPLACKDFNITGIYPIDFGVFEAYCGLSREECLEALTFLNARLPDILEYDFQSRVIFIKKFFVEQAGYKPGISVIPDIIKSFQLTYSTVPHFWKQFSEIHGSTLRLLLNKIENLKINSEGTPKKDKLTEEDRKLQSDFLIDLLSLKDAGLPEPKLSSPPGKQILYEQITLF